MRSHLIACYSAAALLLSCGVAAAARVDPAAAKALGQAMTTLRAIEKANPGAAPAARQLRSLIKQAAPGAVRFGAIVGHSSDTRAQGGELTAGAELGSTSGGWRLGGAVTKTRPAISTEVVRKADGNGFVMLDAVLPRTTQVFGVRGSEVHATLMVWPKDGKGEIAFRVADAPGFARRDDGFKKGTEQTERVFRFDLKGAPVADWRKVPFQTRSTGVFIVE